MSSPDRTQRLNVFIRAHRDQIIAAWEQAVRTLPVARNLDRLTLIDDIPSVLDRIADLADDLGGGSAPQLPEDVAEIHAIERLGEGFDLGQVVIEFNILRDCITRLWQEGLDDPPHLFELRVLHQAIDKAVTASIDRYTRARDRTLQALDRLANAALESRSLDDFLQRLLGVLVETTAAVDVATILLRDGDVLQVRASFGLEEEVQQKVTQRIGEGFAGTIAATALPLEVRDATTDPIIQRPALREAGIRALYGVPLVDGGVIGVAHMGSRTAHEFSKQDQQLFRAMAQRATAAIYQHVLREQAERTAAELQQAVRTREEVLAIVSHDLRNPLSAIDHAATSLLHEHGAVPRSRKQLEVIRRSTTRMAHLINDLLDLATIEAKGLSLNLAPHDVGTLLRGIVEAHEPLASERGIQIRLECELEELRLWCDRDRVEQVLANLLENAKKYCRPGDVILVRAARVAGAAQLSVADTGPGIAPEELPHLFQPYWAAKRPSVKQGTGLGLYICRGIVEAHGGKLWAESKPGEGASFTFTLPLVSAGTAPSGPSR